VDARELAKDPSRRRRLTPGKQETVAFRANRVMSHLVQSGSRIVAVVRVIKETGRQINLGTGKEVSSEGAKDAGAPLQIDFSAECFLELPVAAPN
jgi:hypothetical protein